MKAKFHIAGGLLLCIAALLVSTALLPGEAYARYAENTESWTVVARQRSLIQTEEELKITPEDHILSEENNALSIVLPDPPGAIDVEVKILSDSGEYVACAAEAPSVIVSGEIVLVHLGSNNIPAGTYQLELAWLSTSTEAAEATEATEATEASSDETTTDENTNAVSTAVITFFVNYKSGGEGTE